MRASTPVAPPPAFTEEPITAPAEPTLGEGFAPPASLLVLPPSLDVEWAALRRPARIDPGEPVHALAEPWPEWIPVAPPVPEWVPSRPCRSQHYLAHELRPLRTVEYDYDDGRLARRRTDDDTDGSLELEERFSWGRDGRLGRLWERTGPEPTCEGLLPASVTETEHLYDDHGVWLGTEVSLDGASEPGPVWAVTRYDAEHRPLRWISLREMDVERALEQTWDRRGRLRERVTYEGVHVTRVERWLYVSEHERYEARWEDAAWSVHRVQLDDAGRPTRSQDDSDGDGVVDGITTHAYDAQGREVSRVIDADGDGEGDTRIETEYDAAGRRRLEVTTGPEGVREQTWKYDERGRMLRWSSKLRGHWAEDFEEHRYDAQGLELERGRETYHAVRSASDLSSYVTREHWRGEYDERGRLVRAFVLQGDLGPDERIEYAYDCHEPYPRHPRRNPLDHPETAAQCLEDFE